MNSWFLVDVFILGITLHSAIVFSDSLEQKAGKTHLVLQGSMLFLNLGNYILSPIWRPV